jgi:hypothetical protein
MTCFELPEIQGDAHRAVVMHVTRRRGSQMRRLPPGSEQHE